MKFRKLLPLVLTVACLLTACTYTPKEGPVTEQENTPVTQANGSSVVLSDDGITIDGKPVSDDIGAAVYTANDIVYYESGKSFAYGEGSENDAHTPEEAAAHTVVHITKPGTYTLSGKLSLGQIAVDLGKDAKKDPCAVVTLILNGVDITCKVAPAVIFYNVYECGSSDTETATKDVDTSAAGANVIIADDTVNVVNGSYVARIYKPDSVVLNESQTKVEDAKKLHKYDGAFYSKMSMNLYGGDDNSGVLNIYAENEGLDSELHLTIHGGNIQILSGNDGINTNEDGISVTTVNGGNLTIQVTGNTGEGDGIDSNGWLVINGGTVMAQACSDSADAGIDSDMGIHINGGMVIASGHMLDRIEDGGQNYAVFNFSQQQPGGETISMKDKDGNNVFAVCPENAFSVLVYSSPDLEETTCTLWQGNTQLAGQSGNMMGGMMGNMDRPDRPEDMQIPEGQMPPNGQMNGDFTPPEGEMPDSFAPPEGESFPQRPQGGKPGGFEKPDQAERSPDFVIRNGGNMFSGISEYK